MAVITNPTPTLPTKDTSKMDACGSSIRIGGRAWAGPHLVTFITALATASTYAWIFGYISTITFGGFMPILFRMMAVIISYWYKNDNHTTTAPKSPRYKAIPPPVDTRPRFPPSSNRTILQSPIFEGGSTTCDAPASVIATQPRSVTYPTRTVKIQPAAGAPPGLVAEVVSVPWEVPWDSVGRPLVYSTTNDTAKRTTRTRRPAVVEIPVSSTNTSDSSSASKSQPAGVNPRFWLPVIDDEFVDFMIAVKRFSGQSTPPTPTTGISIPDRFVIDEEIDDCEADEALYDYSEEALHLVRSNINRLARALSRSQNLSQLRSTRGKRLRAKKRISNNKSMSPCTKIYR